MKKSIVLTVLAALSLLVLGWLISCGEKVTETPTTPQTPQGSTGLHKTSDGCGVTPTEYNTGPGGNVECSQVGTYQFSSPRFDGGDQCGGTYGPITWTTTPNEEGECTYVSWTFDGKHCGLAVILKGSDAANVYVYDENCQSDFGLASPIAGGSGKPAGLSNITFCWTECEQEECFEDETAWGAGTRYVSRGNWATYTSYSGVAKTVTLFAGQTLNAGTVHFSAPSGGQVTITITLNAGWRFDPDTDESVKIQDYASPPPAVNPSPGLFAWKGDAESSPFSITVPQNNYYGVHVDVEQQVDCPE